MRLKPLYRLGHRERKRTVGHGVSRNPKNSIPRGTLYYQDNLLNRIRPVLDEPTVTKTDLYSNIQPANQFVTSYNVKNGLLKTAISDEPISNKIF